MTTLASVLSHAPVMASEGPSPLAPALAAPQPSTPDLSSMSLEDLLNVRVYAAARKEQSAMEATAAVFVLTRDDIRRSGMTTVPDLLRLVPGVQVAAIDSDNWAISVRGFNHAFSNSLLVLIDGRSVYNRLWSGVNWKTHDLMLDNIERIEVIRGSGGALWGANAVNGVINIVTKAASATEGGLATVEAGGPGYARGAVRYGGSLGQASYRVFSQWSTRGGDVLDSVSARVDDEWSMVTNGVRLDRELDRDALTLDAAVSYGSYEQHGLYLTSPDPSSLTPLEGRETAWQGHVLGRWTRSFYSGAAFTLQSYGDVHTSDESGFVYERRLADVEARFRIERGRHDLGIGAGWRAGRESYDGAWAFELVPGEEKYTIFNLFAQDEISLAADRVRVTLGSKFEHDSATAWGVQPTARALCRLVPERHHVWGAASRALRTPSIADRALKQYAPGGMAMGLPVVTGIVGNPDYETEVLGSFEAGYRWNIMSNAALDLAGFVNHYDRLPSYIPVTPTVEFTPIPHVLAPFTNINGTNAVTRGLELTAQWHPTTVWRIDAGYTAFGISTELEPGATDAFGMEGYDGWAPRHQWQARSGWTLPRGQFDVTVTNVGRLRQMQVPGYTRADVRAETRLSSRLSLALAGQDLFDGSHVEYADGLVPSFQTRRKAHVELRYAF